jgi:hypothetical protein
MIVNDPGSNPHGTLLLELVGSLATSSPIAVFCMSLNQSLSFHRFSFFLALIEFDISCYNDRGDAQTHSFI